MNTTIINAHAKVSQLVSLKRERLKKMKKNLLKILSLVLAVAFSTIAQATPTAQLRNNNSNANSNATIDIATFGSYTSRSGVSNLLAGDFDCNTNSVADDLAVVLPDSNGYAGSVAIHSGTNGVGLSGGDVTSSTYTIQASSNISSNSMFIVDVQKIADINDDDSDGCPELVILAAEHSTTGAETLYIFKSSTINSWPTNSTYDETNADISISTAGNIQDSYEYLNNVGAINDSSNTTNGEYLALCTTNINCYFFSVLDLLSTVPMVTENNGDTIYSGSSSSDIESLTLVSIQGNGIHESMAHGDINGDTYQDLILGSYDNSAGSNVVIIYGPISESMSTVSTNGQYGSTFNSLNSYSTTQDPGDDNLRITGDDEFGSYVGAIDIDNDGKDELIIGNAGDNVAGTDDLYYLISGIDTMISIPTNTMSGDASSGTYNLSTSGIYYVTYSGDSNDSMLATPNGAIVGNFNGDNYQDLVLGGRGFLTPDSSSTRVSNGVSYIFLGGDFESDLFPSDGISVVNDLSDSAVNEAYLQGAESNDNFSEKNVVGDFDGDGDDELVVLALNGTTYNNRENTAVYIINFPNNNDTDGDGQYAIDGDCNDMNSNVYLQTWYLDADGDGYGDANTSVESCEQPTGYVDYDPNVDEFDCDDTDATINPDTVWYYDFDLDGYGDSSQSTVTCQQPRSSIGTHVLNDSDCDDRDSTINPDTVWYLDSDGDGYGDANTTTTQCSQPTNYVLDDTDCNDADANLNSETLWYLDSDGDGFGNPDATVASCEQPTGYLVDDTDCDDSRAAINPNTVWYEDADHDGYGNPDHSIQSCEMPTGYVLQGTDINDSESSVYPGAPEICDDNIDNDSDGLTDGQDQVDCNDFDYDDDGYSSLDGDCDDENPVVYPGARELADAIDNDCDGLLDDGLMNVGASIIGNNTIHAGENFEIRLSLDNLTGLENFKIQVLLPDSPDSNFTRYVKTVANQFPTSRNLGILNQNGGGLRNDMCANDNCKVVSEMEVTLRAAQDEEFTLVSNVPADFVAGHYPLRVRIIDTDTNQVVGWLNNFFLNTPASEIIYIRVQDR